MDSIYQKRKKLLLDYFRKYNHLPSYSEMTELFGLRSKGSLYKYVKSFINEGIVYKNERGVLAPTSQMFGLRVLGTIQAGFPSPAEEELADTISMDEYLLRNPEASFLLTVTGDSMIDAGIMPGDMVIVERGRNPINNDIVIAEIDGEWTMKYFIKIGNKNILRAANDKYPDFEPQEELKIEGVVTSVVRRYK